MRLTKKKWHQLNNRKKDWFEYVLNEKYSSYDRLYKLGELEDIEEELGIDLVTFLKATIDGIYVKYNEHFNLIDGPFSFKYDKDEKCFYNYVRDMNASWEEQYYLKDYGKTWALTMEELK